MAAMCVYATLSIASAKTIGANDNYQGYTGE